MRGISSRRWKSAALALSAALGCGRAAFGAHLLTRIVDTSTAVPGEGATKFVLPGGTLNTTSIQGGRIVFARNTPPHQELWTASVAGGDYLEIVDKDALIPSGTGSFSEVSPFVLDGGTVLFRGSSGGNAGLYVLPVGGGAISMLANQDTVIPGEAVTFATLIGSARFDLDDGLAVFADSFQTSGVYTVPAAGGPIARVANNDQQICELGYTAGGVFGFALPKVDDGVVAIEVHNTFGQATVYTLPTTGAVTSGPEACTAGRSRVNNATLIATANIALPDDPLSRNFDFLMIGAPPGPVIDAGTVVFAGAAQRAEGVLTFDHGGLYAWTQADGLVTLADRATPVPGGTGNFVFVGAAFGGILTSEYVIDAGRVVFLGRDEANVDALFAMPATGGPIERIVGEGDTLDSGRTVTAFNTAIGSSSLDGDLLSFRVDYFDAGLAQSGNGIYVVQLPLFADGFESGDKTAWSSSAP